MLLIVYEDLMLPLPAELVSKSISSPYILSVAESSESTTTQVNSECHLPQENPTVLPATAAIRRSVTVYHNNYAIIHSLHKYNETPHNDYTGLFLLLSFSFFLLLLLFMLYFPCLFSASFCTLSISLSLKANCHNL